MTDVPQPAPADLKAWQAHFIAALPRITAHAEVKFGFLQRKNPEKFEDCVRKVEELAWREYYRIRIKGEKDPDTFIATIADFSVRQVKDGRDVARMERAKDVLSPRAQRKKGFYVGKLPEHDTCEHDCEPLEALIDYRVGDPGDIAAFRLDVPAFRESLTPPQQQVMDAAVAGDTTTEMAARLKVTPGAVSQMRRRIAEKYLARDEEEALSR